MGAAHQEQVKWSDASGRQGAGERTEQRRGKGPCWADELATHPSSLRWRDVSPSVAGKRGHKLVELVLRAPLLLVLRRKRDVHGLLLLPFKNGVLDGITGLHKRARCAGGAKGVGHGGLDEIAADVARIFAVLQANLVALEQVYMSEGAMQFVDRRIDLTRVDEPTAVHHFWREGVRGWLRASGLSCWR